MVKRGLKVVGCVSYNDEHGMLSDLALRPSVDKIKVRKCICEAPANHAKKSGKNEIYTAVQSDENRDPTLNLDKDF